MKKLVLFLITLTCIWAQIHAQSWVELGSTSTTALNIGNSKILSICTDSQGNIYAAGYLLNANNYYYVAKWNGTYWSELGTAPGSSLNANGLIYALCSDNNGNIYAAGDFTYAGQDYTSVPGKRYVAKWDGNNWSILGGTVSGTAIIANHTIQTICTDPQGNIYASGDIYDSNSICYVTKWDGNKWSILGGTISGITNSIFRNVQSICSDPSGNIYVGGDFVDSNGNYYVAKWDGYSWSELGGTVSGIGLNANNGIHKVHSDVFGNIYAGGLFTNTKGEYYIAEWNGISWSELGTMTGTSLEANGQIVSICSDSLGNVYASGGFSDKNSFEYVAKWNGISWSEVGGTVSGISLNADIGLSTICNDNKGNLYASAYFTNPNVTKIKYFVAKFSTSLEASTSAGSITRIDKEAKYLNGSILSFFPNPTKNSLTINSEVNGYFSIYNLYGDLNISQYLEAGSTFIELNSLASGIYIGVFLGQNKSSQFIRIVKE